MEHLRPTVYHQVYQHTYWESQKESQRQKGLFEKIVAKKSPNLMKYIHPHIQEAQDNPSKIN